jgi:transcriptional antiterminator RfaH
MPILAPETCEFPAGLLSGYDGITDREWWALYTRPRQEKSLARALVQMELPFYLPLVKKRNLIRGREVVSLLPLFQGYLFLYGDNEERLRSLTTKRVAQVVPVNDPERLVSDLRRIQQLIESGEPLTIESRLSAGRRVRIRAGAMQGLEGTVVVRRGQSRLLVAIDFIQQGASVAIDDYLLESLD